MKVIDLLNKIANDEEIPEMIKVDSYIWRYDNILDDYIDDKTENYLMNRYNMLRCLDYEVEIIEEKKIPKKLNNTICKDMGVSISIEPSMEELKNKINEIIDYLKSKGE